MTLYQEPTISTTNKRPFCKRIIPCLDVDSNGRTVKGIQFQGLRDMGDPVAMAAAYEAQGADELLFLDISASHEGRKTLASLVERVAQVLSIPFTVGGGISTLEQVTDLLSRGADKVSINSSAVHNPQLITDIARHCGSQCCVVAIDARRGPDRHGRPSWDVLVKGGRHSTGLDALEWAQQAVAMGAGEILLTSWDKDGTRDGFDLALTNQLASALPVPVIASGGANGPGCFVDVFGPQGAADAALAASIFHEGQWTVAALKEAVAQAGIPMRL